MVGFCDLVGVGIGSVSKKRKKTSAREFGLFIKKIDFYLGLIYSKCQAICPVLTYVSSSSFGQKQWYQVSYICHHTIPPITYFIKLTFKCSFIYHSNKFSHENGLLLNLLWSPGSQIFIPASATARIRNYLLMLIDVFLFSLCLFLTYRSGGAKGPGIFFIIPCTDSYQKVRAVISTIILLVLVM